MIRAAVRMTLAGLALFGAAAASAAPGNGWSRAPDLSVYGALTTFGQVAREESALCAGFRTATVVRRWEREFAGREAAVTAALVERHGAEAVQRAAQHPTRRIECPDSPYGVWWRHYERLLGLLERRMGLA
jgi:hypothetical protein